jgi:hypothetical protein
MATVQELYQQILGREAEPAGLLYWENQFGGQVDPAEVERFQAAAASELAQRQAESVAASNAAAAAAAGVPNVEALYQSQLGRASDPGGLAYWSNKFGREIDANELAQFQIEAAKEIAGRTTGVRPPVVPVVRPPGTPVPVAPRPVVPGGVGNVVGGGGSVYPGDTSGVFLGGGSPGMTSVMPFSNVGQGLATNFANYQSIPIGSQYNPGVTAGGVSPYAQVMGQMRPLGNPYANVMAGQAMGGYDPALYDQILANNAARAVAGDISASGIYDGGGGGGDGGGYAKGGIVNRLTGPNPPGPDDGAGYLERGEYVIKKSSVNKYGRGLLDMINEGKVPAKKMKSLLG